MPYQVQQLIEGKGMPVCVTMEDTVAHALALMIEHDFSQLPVTVREVSHFDVPRGLVTYEGILRGLRNFKASIDDLRVRDVMTSAAIFNAEDDLFDILDRLKDTNAVLIMAEDGIPALAGIVTSYDTTEYFRERTEDLMRVEDIEAMIKDLITAAYQGKDGETDDDKLVQAISRVCHRGPDEKVKTFGDLSLSEYVSLLTLKDTWAFFQPIFNLRPESLRELLGKIRETRNILAHFRGDISAEQRDTLKFATDWIARCQENYQVIIQNQRIKPHEEAAGLENLSKKSVSTQEPVSVPKESNPYLVGSQLPISSTDFAVTESATGGGRYALLADWLQSQPGSIGQVPLTLNQIEEIIGSELPPSARDHRAWWANDSVGHTQSRLWLDAGWRTTYVSLGVGRVTFTRIRDREKAYISFFSKLLDELRKKANFPVREISPDGASWVVIQEMPRRGQSSGSFSYSFTRDKRLRVELYLDLLDQAQTKRAFDKLYEQKDKFEQQLGPIEWERLDSRRASRLALYKEGQIIDQKLHAELRQWAVDSMIKFFNVMVGPTEQAIKEAKQE